MSLTVHSSAAERYCCPLGLWPVQEEGITRRAKSRDFSNKREGQRLQKAFLVAKPALPRVNSIHPFLSSTPSTLMPVLLDHGTKLTKVWLEN